MLPLLVLLVSCGKPPAPSPAPAPPASPAPVDSRLQFFRQIRDARAKGWDQVERELLSFVRMGEMEGALAPARSGRTLPVHFSNPDEVLDGKTVREWNEEFAQRMDATLAKLTPDFEEAYREGSDRADRLMKFLTAGGAGETLVHDWNRRAAAIDAEYAGAVWLTEDEDAREFAPQSIRQAVQAGLGSAGRRVFYATDLPPAFAGKVGTRVLLSYRSKSKSYSNPPASVTEHLEVTLKITATKAPAGWTEDPRLEVPLGSAPSSIRVTYDETTHRILSNPTEDARLEEAASKVRAWAAALPPPNR